MVKMIAEKAFNYRWADVAVGDEFDVEDAHVEVFTLTGHAHVVGASQGYATRVMEAAQTVRRRVVKAAH